MASVDERLDGIERRQRYILVGLILDYLNREEIRATYGAVGEIIGKIPQNVHKWLPPRSRRASWVVNKDTKLPTTYATAELHPKLRRTSHIIEDAEELRERLGWKEKHNELPGFWNPDPTE